MSRTRSQVSTKKGLWIPAGKETNRSSEKREGCLSKKVSKRPSGRREQHPITLDHPWQREERVDHFGSSMAPAGKKERRRSRITLDQDHFKSTRPAAPGRKEEDKKEKEGKVDEVNRVLPLWQLSCLPERRKTRKYAGCLPMG